MSGLDQTLQALAGHIKEALATLECERKSIADMLSESSRIEARLNSLRANDVAINNELAKKASEVAGARSFIEKADATAHGIIADAQTKANAIINNAVDEAAAIVAAGKTDADNHFAKAQARVHELDAQIAAHKSELDSVIEHIKSAKESFAALKRQAAAFAAE